MSTEVPEQLIAGSSTMTQSQPYRGLGRSSQAFIPKPFPPPALRDVPESYIVSQLHRLAPSYWHRPETADCTIIIPCDSIAHRRSSQNAPQPPCPDPLSTGPFSSQTGQISRRDSEPAPNSRRMILKLHQDYLSSQSMFMRALFSGSSPLDLNAPVAPPASLSISDTPSPPLPPPRQPTSHLAAGAFPVHPSRHPRVLPSSSPHHPVVFLPVPDASSFPHLVHYLYFGKFNYMEECLHRGIVTWQGIVRNVEYLGMRLELKASLGRYYRQWLRPNTPIQDPEPADPPETEDSEDEDSGSAVSLSSAVGEGPERREHGPYSSISQPVS